MSTSPSATHFPELDLLLVELTERTGDILGDNRVGVYLQGSFALGDSDFFSDVDFLIPVHSQVTQSQEAALRALHAELPTRPAHWARHLEGSYPVAHELRSRENMNAEWLYIDHGWREMQWSNHCNNLVARWSLREYGVRLAGPEPRTLVDEVPAADLRAFARASAGTFMADFTTWMTLDIAWGQRYAVTTWCRILATLESGRVVSKQAALEWGRRTLGTEWGDLLQQVIDDRARGFDQDDTARPGTVEQTLAFAAFAEERARTPQGQG